MPSIAAYAFSTGIAGYSSKKIDVKRKSMWKKAPFSERIFASLVSEAFLGDFLKEKSTKIRKILLYGCFVIA